MHVSLAASEAEVERLRDEAAGLLQEAAACGDTGRRDALTRAALTSIDQARRLVDFPCDLSLPWPRASRH